jgi:class 3 adenylate cyclase
MATLSSVNRRAYSPQVSLFFLLFLLFLSAVAGELFWVATKNLKLSLIVTGSAAVIFCVWWFFFQWQTNVTWLCRLQMIFFGAGALPSDHRFIDDAMPWNIRKRTEAVINTAEEMIQTAQKDLVANRHAMDKYLGTHATRYIKKGESSTEVGGQLESLFILFCDIRGFTSMTEKLTAKETMRVLNHVFSSLAAVIENNGGEINKFIGDSILAYFRWTAEKQKTEAEKVVFAALEMQKRFAYVAANDNDLKTHMIKIGLGIGIVAGHAFMGNLGSRHRMEFTLISDNVNLSSRICSIASEGEILVNETLAMLVNDKFFIESRMPVQLKGKSEKTTPYCITGALNPS